MKRPSLEYRTQFLKYLAEFEDAGEESFRKAAEIAREDFPKYLEILERQSEGVATAEGFNAEQIFWVFDEKEVLIGTCAVRHPVTSEVENTLGHLGGSVRPSYRRKGYGTVVMDLLMNQARKIGLKKAICIVEKTNLASQKIIEKFGGKVVGEELDESSGTKIIRYRISL